jgi:hypothetical protein
MAKRPAKTKKAKKKAVDPLANALSLLSTADRDSSRVLRALGRALGISVQKIQFKICKFDLNGKKYRARVTVYQRQVILDAVNSNSNVFMVVISLLGNLNGQLTDAFNNIGAQLGDPVKLPFNQVAMLGCCVCDAGKLPNLTQSQCNTFNPTSWGSPADCAGAPPA